VPMLVALVAGSATAIACAIWLARAFGLDRAEILALAPKSATEPSLASPSASTAC